jgi:allantoin racemase
VIMKILVINPNTSALMTGQINQAARRYANPVTEITTVCAGRGPRTIEDEYDAALTAMGTLEQVILHEAEYDGFIIACGVDTGLYACREMTPKPVVGIAEAGFYMACLLGHKFTSLTTLPRMVPVMEHMVKRYGLKERCASVRAVGARVLDIAGDQEKLVGAFIREGARAIEEDGADVLCLSGAPMVGMDKRMEQALGVPVTDSVVSAVKLIEAQVEYRLKTSRKAFSSPEKKEAIHIDEGFQSIYR